MKEVEGLVEALRYGCVLHPKRWSGDTHDDLGGSIDEAATDALMAQAAAALAEAQVEVESWKSQVYDEIAANLNFREDGGALPDEDMPTFCARLIAEKQAAESELAALRERLAKAQIVRVESDFIGNHIDLPTWHAADPQPGNYALVPIDAAVGGGEAA